MRRRRAREAQRIEAATRLVRLGSAARERALEERVHRLQVENLRLRRQLAQLRDTK